MNFKFLCVAIMVTLPLLLCGQSFGASGLAGEGLANPTSLQFGPDGRLYVSQQDGTLYAYTVARNGANDYAVTATEIINSVKNISNHNDDGTVFNGSVRRQVTGILVAGTPSIPVLYVSSSDYRIGGGGSGADKNLDTNSGMVSRLTKTATGWAKVDLVRGLPRSEQNHATNGMQLDATGTILYVAQGGHTNAGAPSNNFAFSTEYALSGAILTVDLGAVDALPTQTDVSDGSNYKYDLPTLDDPTRPNANGQDVGDPFGGNDGLNQAMIVPGGPVQVYSPGYRNAYDVVLTEAGRLYTWDNGANAGWGGHPDNEGLPSVTNNWVPGEPGSRGPGPNDAQVNNRDNLHLITGLGYYGGHPNPVRANPAGAGLFTNDQAGGENGVFRTSFTGDPAVSLPVNWPPVPASLANPEESDFRNPGVDDDALFTIASSTNGLTEYRTDNFSGSLQGDLLAASFNGKIYRVRLNGQGRIDGPQDVVVFAENFGASPLDVTALGSNDPFPGTVWAATYGSNNITIFEPNDYEDVVVECLGEDLTNVDDDSDGYTNADEIANGTDPCNGASQPDDFDGSLINGYKVSDLNDPDDDDDGINDILDKFAWDASNGLNNSLPLDYPFLNGDPGFGFFGLGFTGLMTNGSEDYLELIRNEDNSTTEIIAGGAVGLLTFNGVPQGTVRGAVNDQLNGFQFGLAVDATTPAFTIEVGVLGPVFTNLPTGGQAVGFYVGNGDQDNYLSIAVNAGAGSPVVEVLKEDAGIPVGEDFSVPGLTQASEISLLLLLDPANGSVQPAYALNGGAPIMLGVPLSLSGATLGAITNANEALAVGMLTTANGGTTPFNATYDFLKAYATAPTPSVLNGPSEVEINNTEILTFTNELGNQSITISDLSLGGSNGFTFLPYTALPVSLAPGEAFEVEVSYTGTENVSSLLTLTHDGSNGPQSSTMLSGLGTPSVGTEYRINCGGPEVTTGGLTWSADAYSLNGSTFTNAQAISNTTDDVLYQTERWNAALAYAFPVNNGTYDVTLHFADIWQGSQGAGIRVFNVALEGQTVLSNFDIFAEVGGFTALVESFTVTILDGELNLSTQSIIQNPKVSAIVITPSCQPGTPCDDGDVCTFNDVYDANCNCSGEPEPDGDLDGICDSEDTCPYLDNALLGTACDDGDPCTENDVYGPDCNCAGTALPDTDGDGLCDAIDSCPALDNALVGTVCDDGDPCTDNDVYGTDCNCSGTTIPDTDGDGLCDALDSCPALDNALLGTTCDDGDPCTENDVYGADCNCAGTALPDTDGDGLCDALDSCPALDNALLGTACDDGDPCTDNDVYGTDCNCAGTTIPDMDGDGLCDAIDSCPALDNSLLGTACDDGDPCTDNDVYDTDCNCSGTALPDTDGDGLCDAIDSCPALDNVLLGTACDDGDPCTDNDLYDIDCNCTGTAGPDTDGDGICDALDVEPLSSIYVNCGGPTVSALGQTWEADNYFVNGRSFSTSRSISNTNADVLYKTERWNQQLAYAVPVVDGEYLVTLHFADIYRGTQGVNLRVFDVLMEGSLITNDFDIYAEVGGYAALVKQQVVTVTDGTLNLNFSREIENPKLSAFSITPATAATSTGWESGRARSATSTTIGMPSQVKVFPNPVKNERLTVSYRVQEPGEVALSMFDVNGKAVFRSAFTVVGGENRLAVRLPQVMPSGVYFLQLIDGQERTTVRVLVD